MLLHLLFQKSVRLFSLTCLVLLLAGCGDNQVSILAGLDQETANNITLALGNENINANKTRSKDGTYSITVLSSKKLEALNILNLSGLPKRSFTSLGEVFKKDSFISSPLEEHSRFLYALNQEISNMLSSINGVVEVKTIVNVPAANDNLLQSSDSSSSASVLIKYRPYLRGLNSLMKFVHELPLSLFGYEKGNIKKISTSIQNLILEKSKELEKGSASSNNALNLLKRKGSLIKYI